MIVLKRTVIDDDIQSPDEHLEQGWRGRGRGWLSATFDFYDRPSNRCHGDMCTTKH